VCGPTALIAFKFDVDESGIDVALGAPIPRAFGISKIIQEQSGAVHGLSEPLIEGDDQRGSATWS
jgi:hypothetical protein